MKKGFTLAELMGVIVILGIISIIVMTAIDKSIVNSRYSDCKIQEKNLVEATKMLVTDDVTKLPVNASTPTRVTVMNLIDGGYLNEKEKNPMTDKLYKDSGNDIYVEISITSKTESGTVVQNKDYKYTVKYNNSKEACHK